MPCSSPALTTTQQNSLKVVPDSMLTSARISVAFLLVGLLTRDVSLSPSSSSLSLLSLNLFSILWAPKYVLKLSRKKKEKKRIHGIQMYVAVVCIINVCLQICPLAVCLKVKYSSSIVFNCCNKKLKLKSEPPLINYIVSMHWAV